MFIGTNIQVEQTASQRVTIWTISTCQKRSPKAIMFSVNPIASDQSITRWLFNIAMENDPFVDDFPS